MIEPVALQDFFITFFSSALIILAGASYALLFAWSKVNPNFRIKIAALVSYAVLTLSVAELTRAAQFQGYWLIISFVMVILDVQVFKFFAYGSFENHPAVRHCSEAVGSKRPKSLPTLCLPEGIS